MRELSSFVIGNNINRKKNIIVIAMIVLLSCLCIYGVRLCGGSINEMDYFFVTWFMINIYYIYLIADIASFDFEEKIINFSYSAGLPRNKYLLNKIMLLASVGLIHGIIIFVGYKGIFSNFIVKSNYINGSEAIIIYLLVFLFIGSIDMILALLSWKKSQIIMSNIFIIIILPTVIQTVVSAINNSFLLKAFKVSPFSLISSVPMDLSINFTITIVAVLSIIVANIVNFNINNSKDF